VRCKGVERFVHGKEFLLLWTGSCDLETLVVYIHVFCAGAIFRSEFATRTLDENAAHRLGSSGKEMCTVGESSVAESQPGLVNEGRGLKRVARLFASHFGTGELAELGIDEREQLLAGAGIAALDGSEKAGDVAHRRAGCGRERR
jgi:hypothetical protein